MTNEDIIKEIVREQGQIVGAELAKIRASSSGVIKYNSEKIDDFVLLTDPKVALEKIIDSYRIIFGQTSVEVCLKIIKKYPHVAGI